MMLDLVVPLLSHGFLGGTDFSPVGGEQRTWRCWSEGLPKAHCKWTSSGDRPGRRNSERFLILRHFFFYHFLVFGTGCCLFACSNNFRVQGNLSDVNSFNTQKIFKINKVLSMASWKIDCLNVPPIGARTWGRCTFDAGKWIGTDLSVAQIKVRAILDPRTVIHPNSCWTFNVTWKCCDL